MFRSWLIAFTLVLTLGALALGYHLSHLTSKDKTHFQKLMRSSDPSRDESAESYRAHQERQDVTKDIWYANNNKRLRIHLSSENSEIILQLHNEHSEVTEHMTDVRGIIQEELYYVLPDGKELLVDDEGKLLFRSPPEGSSGVWEGDIGKLIPMQRVTTLVAAEASLNYRTQIFVAQTVDLTKYEVVGHELPDVLSGESPTMKGKAKVLELFMQDGEPAMRARQLKATLYSGDEIWSGDVLANF